MKSNTLLALAANLGVAIMLVSTTAHAADIRVLCTNGIKTVMMELAPQFERATGHRVSVDFDASAPIAGRMRKGEAADLAIVTDTLVDALAKEGKLTTGSRVDLARSLVGLAVRAGAPIPDISTVDAFKRTILEAKSVSYASAGASGTYFVGLAERMGMGPQLKAKAKTQPTGAVAELVARGESELVVLLIPELMAVPGLHIVGPIPKEIQSVTTFSAGVGADTRQAEAARALASYLTTPAARAVFKAKGLETD